MVNLDLVLTIIPKVGSTISIPASLFIISEAISDHHNGKGTAIQRALVGMSVVDVCASFAWFLSSWAVPEGTAPLSKGNMASCNFQGFLLQLAVGAPLYNCSLSLYYMLVIKYNWTNEQLVKIERYVHAFIITFVVGTSIVGLPLTMYNKVTTVCWVIGLPSECGNSSSNPSDVPCERGDWAWLFGIILFYGPLWICVILTIIAMVLIYIQVRQTFGRNEKYRFQGQARRPTRLPSSVRTGISDKTSGEPQQNFINDSPHRIIDTAGQMSTRMSRFSVFSSKNKHNMREIEELQMAIEQNEEGDDHEDEEEGGEDDDNGDGSLPQNRATSATPAFSESELSGGIGLKSGWMVAARTSVSSNNAEYTTKPTEETAKGFPLRRRANSPTSCRARRKQNLFATQAILYSGSFFITWTPSTIWSVAYWFGVGGLGFDLAAATCEPLQGFWNMLIFIRSRPGSQEKLRRIFGSFCCFWLALLPRMSDEFGRSSSRVAGSTHSDPAEARRLSVSKALATNDSAAANAYDVHRISEKEDNGEQDKSVQFDTEKDVGDS